MLSDTVSVSNMLSKRFSSQETIDDKVRNKLVRDARLQKEKDKAEAKEKALTKIQNDMEWKQKKNEYKVKRKQAITDVAQIYFDGWKEELDGKSKLRKQDSNCPQETIDKFVKENDEKTVKKISERIDDFRPVADQYVKDAYNLKKHKYKVENEIKYVLSQGKRMFMKLKNKFMDKVKKMLKQKSFDELNAQLQDKINQELANLPLKIDEILDNVEGTLDMLLGKAFSALEMPNNPDFDIDILIAKIKALLNPVIAATNPLVSVVGDIPVIGEITGLIQLAGANSKPTTGLSKDDIKKLMPKPPDIDPKMKDQLVSIKDNIMTTCQMLPMILINLIFAMINVIYSKLKIITSIIPLGGMFPLSLIPAAIDAGPKITTLVMQLPGMIDNCLRGLIKQKLAEAMALQFPKPDLDDKLLSSLIEDVKQIKAKKKAQAKLKKSYGDVTKEAFKTVRENGYTEMQIKNIQKSYKEIHDGTDLEITLFQDTGEKQVLADQTDPQSLAGMAVATWDWSTTWGDEAKKKEEEKKKEEQAKEVPGFTETKIKRSEASVADYETKLKSYIAKDVSSGIKYPQLKETSGVVGVPFQLYKDQLLKKYGEEVVLEETIKPARTVKKTEEKK